MWHRVDWRDLPIAFQKPSGDGLHQPACIALNVPGVHHTQTDALLLLFCCCFYWKCDMKILPQLPELFTHIYSREIKRQIFNPTQSLSWICQVLPMSKRSEKPLTHREVIFRASQCTQHGKRSNSAGWSSFRQRRAVLIPSCSICYFSSE